MNRLVLLCLITLFSLPVAAQTDNEPPSLPQVMELGRGTADTLDWHPNGEILAVGGSRGLWFYDEDLADVAYFEDVGAINYGAWSPDGTTLAIIDHDRIMQLWLVNADADTYTLTPLWSFGGGDVGRIANIAWSPEGERLAVSTNDGVQILDVLTSEVLLHIPDLSYTLAWHPDGTQIVGVVNLGEELGEQVRVWDTMTGDAVQSYISPESYLYWSVIQWSPDGSVLVGGTSVPAILHVWDTETGELVNEIDPYTRDFSAFLEMWWLNDGAQLVTVSSYISPPAYAYMEIWDTTAWETLGNPIGLDDVSQIAKQPEADIWTLLVNGQLMNWSLETEETLSVSAVYNHWTRLLSWSPDSYYLTAANEIDRAFYLWDVATAQPLILTNAYFDLTEFRWNAENNNLIGITKIPFVTAPGIIATSFILEWDTETGEVVNIRHETPGYVAHDGSGFYLPDHTWSSDFTRVATENPDEPLAISTVVTGGRGFDQGTVLATIDISNYIYSIQWSPDNSMLAIVTDDEQGARSAWVYDATTGNLIHELLPSFPSDIYDISWSPDSSRLALVSNRGIAGSGVTEYRLDILQVDPSADGASHIATIIDADTRFFHAWHPESFAIVVSTSEGVGIYMIERVPLGLSLSPTWLIPDTPVSALAWSPDGVLLAGSHEDGTIRVWDVTQVQE